VQNDNNKPAAGPWQPMETAPRDGSPVFLMTGFGDPLCARWCEHEKVWHQLNTEGYRLYRSDSFFVAWAEIYEEPKA